MIQSVVNDILSEVVPLIMLFTVPGSLLAACSNMNWTFHWDVFYPALYTLAFLLTGAVVGRYTKDVNNVGKQTGAVRVISSLGVPTHVVGGLFSTLWLAHGKGKVSWNSIYIWFPLLFIGLTLLTWTNVLFVTYGNGTLSPMDPTNHLVVTGPYRFVRNPMISGVLFIMVGISLAVENNDCCSKMLTFTFWFFIAKNIYFTFEEEPKLLQRFGHEYEQYCKHVNRWIPSWQAYDYGGQTKLD